jgi:hypothetical protein
MPFLAVRELFLQILTASGRGLKLHVLTGVGGMGAVLSGDYGASIIERSGTLVVDWENGKM